MKRVLVLLVAASMWCFGLASCSDSDPVPVADLPSSEVAAVTDTEMEASKAQEQEDVTVTVTDKTVTPMDYDQWIYSNYANFVFEITNHTVKDIQGIQGDLEIKDLFGEKIMTVSCDFTGSIIPAGETVTNDELSLECNAFIESEAKVYNEDYEDLQFQYIVSQIVFTDGSVEEY